MLVSQTGQRGWSKNPRLMITSVCQSEESPEVSEESFMHSMCDGPLSGGQQAAMVEMQLDT